MHSILSYSAFFQHILSTPEKRTTYTVKSIDGVAGIYRYIIVKGTQNETATLRISDRINNYYYRRRYDIIVNRFEGDYNIITIVYLCRQFSIPRIPR